MKKNVLLFFLLSTAGIIYLTFPLKKTEHFVTLSNGSFVLNDKPFYPVVINYLLSLKTDGKELWPCPSNPYNIGVKDRVSSKDSSLVQLKSDLELIKELGFNSIRLGIVPDFQIEDELTSIPVSVNIENQISFELKDEKAYREYFDGLDLFFKIANECGLKVIFLTKVLPDYPYTEKHLKKLVQRFKNENTILAYDLFNEPLYFDIKERSKEDVFRIVNRWNKIVKSISPHQLTTIGLEGIREVYEWDPNILNIDFLSFHPYEYELEQVRNEIFWYGKYVKKPWIIGETAIPADNDSISYEDQRQFAHKTIKQAINCGAIGYSWWQYKDVEWNSFHSNYMGILNYQGKTITKSKLVVNGSLKPVAFEFKGMENIKANSDSCICLRNYYNYSNGNKSRIIGKVIDEHNNPIDGAVILAWNENFTSSYHTISKKDGYFELLGTFPFYHWMLSALDYTVVRGELNPDSSVVINNIPNLNIGIQKISKLKFMNE